MQHGAMLALTDHQRAIIGAVLAEPGIRRPEMAERLGISAQTIMRAVRPLLDSGALREDQMASGGRGKPALCLRFEPKTMTTLGISLASDRIRVEFRDLSGQGLAAESVQRAYGSAGAQLADLDALLDDQLARLPESAMLVAAGVSVQGYFLDRGTRFAARADPAGWAAIDLQSHLYDRLGVPIRLMNDGSTVASSLILKAPYRHFICLHLGSGIGGGVVSDGRLLTGANGNAGELGSFFPRNDDRPVEAMFLATAGRTDWADWPGLAALAEDRVQRLGSALTRAGDEISRVLEQTLAVLDFEAVYLCSRMPADLLDALADRIAVTPLGTDLVGQSRDLRNPAPAIHPFHVPHYARLACEMALDSFLSPAHPAETPRTQHGHPVA